ncbi:MAG: acylphosphatase [Acidobacteriota bacterium]
MRQLVDSCPCFTPSRTPAKRPRLKAAHFIIKGKVQGVGFRYFVVKEAQNLGLSGWVRNLPDGSVEARAEGQAESLEIFESSLKQGPSWSRVMECRVIAVTPEDFTGFKIKW